MTTERKGEAVLETARLMKGSEARLVFVVDDATGEVWRLVEIFEKLRKGTDVACFALALVIVGITLVTIAFNFVLLA